MQTALTRVRSGPHVGQTLQRHGRHNTSSQTALQATLKAIGHWRLKSTLRQPKTARSNTETTPEGKSGHGGRVFTYCIAFGPPRLLGAEVISGPFVRLDNRGMP